jgi:hypothetical protein
MNAELVEIMRSTNGRRKCTLGGASAKPTTLKLRTICSIASSDSSMLQMLGLMSQCT